jgi:hypothetical protein
MATLRFRFQSTGKEIAMKNCMLWPVLFLAVSSSAQEVAPPKQPATLGSILLMELRETHNQKNWFVSEKVPSPA